MLDYKTWLETATSVPKVLFVQIDGVLINNVATTIYLSTGGIEVTLASGTTVAPVPIIKNNLEITESIGIDYSSSISFGDVELANNNGEYDAWLNYIWVNKPISIYYGDLPTTEITPLVLSNDMELVFKGIVDDIDSKSFTTLTLKIRNNLERLNYPVTEVLLGNYYHGAEVAETVYKNQYKNNVKPLVFGEVTNITPLLTDPTYNEYMVSNSVVEQIIEVLDNGRPVLFTTTATSGQTAIPAGSFRLSSTPVGTITASVQGLKKTCSTNDTVTDTYTNTASNTLLCLLKLYGKTISLTEVDATSFASPNATQYVGVYVNDRTNLLSLCQEIAKDCRLAFTVTREGLVKLVSLDLPAGASNFSDTITTGDYLLNSLRLTQKPPVIAAVRYGYARNYTVMTNLITGIPQDQKDLLAQEYLEIVQKDTTVQTNYNLTAEPVLEPTYLIDSTQTTALATSKLTLFKTQRKIVGITCTSKFLNARIGDVVRLQIPRFGIANNTRGIITTTKPNWLLGKVDIEVLV
jgi:hypothetical protein